MSLKKETTQVSKIEVPCENEKAKETSVLERYPHCGRKKTPRHETFHFGKKSTYQRDVIVCVDYLDETKIVHEKQLTEPAWKKPLVCGAQSDA